MRALPFISLLVAACSVGRPSPQVADGVPDGLLQEMVKLENAECPVPSGWYTLDGNWYVGWFGTVVGVADGVLAVHMDEPQLWSSDVQHLLLPVSARDQRSGIKGDAVVVGRMRDTLICRYFPSTVGPRELPALGDRTWVDHGTSRELRTRRDPPR
jgi:hypothetical protein